MVTGSSSPEFCDSSSAIEDVGQRPWPRKEDRQVSGMDSGMSPCLGWAWRSTINVWLERNRRGRIWTLRRRVSIAREATFRKWAIEDWRSWNF